MNGLPFPVKPKSSSYLDDYVIAEAGGHYKNQITKLLTGKMIFGIVFGPN